MKLPVSVVESFDDIQRNFEKLEQELSREDIAYETGGSSGATTSTSFVTTAPSVTVPTTGTYLVVLQAQTSGPTVVSASGAGFTPNDNDGFYTLNAETGHGMFEAELTGGGVLQMAFRSTDGGSRSLIRPRTAIIRVSR